MPELLTKQQRESIFLLQIGTFLEYFDLMLFVHMAVILNELFFPKYDAFTSSLLSAFAFCSTFALKPVGALLFGYIGDKVGRKHTVILTTIIMAVSCLIMANVPTYAQIGITASWVITICRGLQGMSSIGESIGAELLYCRNDKTTTKIQRSRVYRICWSCWYGSFFNSCKSSIST